MQEVNTPANPFPGLRPFESDETHLFFGREGQSKELLRRLRLARFLAVVGTSGSGKSSLVRAGLLPALREGLMPGEGASWRVAMFRPGNDPIGNLAAALTRPAVFGTGDPAADAMQTAMTEATLRRGGQRRRRHGGASAAGDTCGRPRGARQVVPARSSRTLMPRARMRR